MTNLLVCIDGSAYADHICKNAAWVAKKLKANVNLLHVLRRGSDYTPNAEDHSGSIGLGARHDLMERLSKVDEERGKLDQQKGRLILQHGEEVLKQEGIKNINVIHRRGSLSETIKELEPENDMVFIGKRGEQANPASEFIGSNLEKVARIIHKPLFVVSKYERPMKRLLISYDGKDHAEKAIDYVATSPLFKGMDVHMIVVNQHDHEIRTAAAINKLNEAGIDVTLDVKTDEHADALIADYVSKNDIDLLVSGAYSHSKMRSMLFGSTTANLIKSCHVPFLLFR